MSLIRLADQLNITPQYLSALFKEHTRSNFLEYVTRRRMAYAASLLKSGLPVQQAAEKCGYNDCEYFKRLFKKHFGRTPCGYLRGREAKP
jgi:two-component system response regulator YesN